MRCLEKIQGWRTSPYQLLTEPAAEGREAAGRGQAQNLVPRCAYFVQISPLPSALTHTFRWKTGSPIPNGRRDLKGLVNVFQKSPSPPPGVS